MNTDGTNFRNITHNALDEDAAWSLNGKRIAFSRGWKDIYVIDASGGTERNITNTPQAIDNNPSWSSDGRKIAFSCVSEICVMDVDGQNRRNLTNNQWTDDIPVWSPDGRQIAFVSERGQGNLSDIYIMDSNGENQRNLTNTPLGRDDYPAWSPDGKWIAWESNGEIYVIHPNGTGLEKLTESPEIYTCPSWFDPDLGRDVFHSGKLPEAWGRLKASF
jgi:TolB protein